MNKITTRLIAFLLVLALLCDPGLARALQAAASSVLRELPGSTYVLTDQALTDRGVYYFVNAPAFIKATVYKWSKRVGLLKPPAPEHAIFLHSDLMTIDGPAGAGKSTVARLVAERLGWQYILVGNICRALAVELLARDISPFDGPAVLAVLNSIHITLNGDQVVVDGRDITSQIRLPEVTRAATVVGTHEDVYHAFNRIQRELAAAGKAILESRDAGLHVLPYALHKFFLTATVNVRAQRRHLELAGPDGLPSLNEVRRDIEDRDRQDEDNPHYRMRPASDAHVIDSSDKTAHEVLSEILRIKHQKDRIEAGRKGTRAYAGAAATLQMPSTSISRPSQFQKTMLSTYSNAIWRSRFAPDGSRIDSPFRFDPRKIIARRVGRYHVFYNPGRAAYAKQTATRATSGKKALYEYDFGYEPLANKLFTFTSGTDHPSRGLVNVNDNTLSSVNVLCMPDVDQVLEQRPTVNSLAYIVDVTRQPENSRTRFAFNSKGAWASVDQLHYHAYYEPNDEPWPVETAPMEKIRKVGGVTEWRVHDTATEGVMMSGGDSHELAHQVMHYIDFLDSQNITYQIHAAPMGVFIYARPERSHADVERWGMQVGDVTGGKLTFYGDRAIFDHLTEQEIDEVIRSTSFTRAELDALISLYTQDSARPTNLRSDVITIDGPAGAGKSTVARIVAERLGWQYIPVGTLYRALAVELLARGVRPTDGPAVLGILNSIQIKLEAKKVLVDGRDVTASLSDPKVGAASALIGTDREVYEAFNRIQRDLAASGKVVLESRDAGLNVIPDAMHKFFLTASISVRAARRFKELAGRGGSIEEVERDIEERDRQDRDNPFYPMKPAEDAYLIDSSDKTIDDVVNEILNIKHENEDAAQDYEGALPPHLKEIIDAASVPLLRHNFSNERVLLVAGGSGSLKTSLARDFMQKLDRQNIESVILHLDDYWYSLASGHLPMAMVDGKLQVNWDVPAATDWDHVRRDVQALLRGEAVQMPELLNFATLESGARSVRLPPKGVLIIDGLLALHPQMLDILKDQPSNRIFIDNNLSNFGIPMEGLLSDELRLMRCLIRDTEQRSLSAYEVFARWIAIVRPGYTEHVTGTKAQANMVIDLAHPEELAIMKARLLPLLTSAREEAVRRGNGPVLKEIEKLSSILQTGSQAQNTILGNHGWFRYLALPMKAVYEVGTMLVAALGWIGDMKLELGLNRGRVTSEDFRPTNKWRLFHYARDAVISASGPLIALAAAVISFIALFRFWTSPLPSDPFSLAVFGTASLILVAFVVLPGLVLGIGNLRSIRGELPDGTVLESRGYRIRRDFRQAWQLFTEGFVSVPPLELSAAMWDVTRRRLKKEDGDSRATPQDLASAGVLSENDPMIQRAVASVNHLRPEMRAAALAILQDPDVQRLRAHRLDWVWGANDALYIRMQNPIKGRDFDSHGFGGFIIRRVRTTDFEKPHLGEFYVYRVMTFWHSYANNPTDSSGIPLGGYSVGLDETLDAANLATIAKDVLAKEKLREDGITREVYFPVWVEAAKRITEQKAKEIEAFQAQQTEFRRRIAEISLVAAPQDLALTGVLSEKDPVVQRAVASVNHLRPEMRAAALTILQDPDVQRLRAHRLDWVWGGEDALYIRMQNPTKSGDYDSHGFGGFIIRRVRETDYDKPHLGEFDLYRVMTFWHSYANNPTDNEGMPLGSYTVDLDETMDPAGKLAFIAKHILAKEKERMDGITREIYFPVWVEAAKRVADQKAKEIEAFQTQQTEFRRKIAEISLVAAPQDLASAGVLSENDPMVQRAVASVNHLRPEMRAAALAILQDPDVQRLRAHRLDWVWGGEEALIIRMQNPIKGRDYDSHGFGGFIIRRVRETNYAKPHLGEFDLYRVMTFWHSYANNPTDSSGIPLGGYTVGLDETMDAENLAAIAKKVLAKEKVRVDGITRKVYFPEWLAEVSKELPPGDVHSSVKGNTGFFRYLAFPLKAIYEYGTAVVAALAGIKNMKVEVTADRGRVTSNEFRPTAKWGFFHYARDAIISASGPVIALSAVAVSFISLFRLWTSPLPSDPFSLVAYSVLSLILVALVVLPGLVLGVGNLRSVQVRGEDGALLDSRGRRIREDWRAIRDIFAASMHFTPDLAVSMGDITGLPEADSEKRSDVMTIDGPAGGGKSTLTRQLAEELGWEAFPVGKLFRALTVAALRQGISPRDGPGLADLARQLDIKIVDGNRVLLNGEDVTSEIQDPKVSRVVAIVNDNREVSIYMHALQQRLVRAAHNIIIESRDAGINVAPDAMHKFWLDGVPDERARRRFLELRAQGHLVTHEEVLREISSRDALDRQTPWAPMRPADDAYFIDTTSLSLDDVRQEILRIKARNEFVSDLRKRLEPALAAEKLQLRKTLWVGENHSVFKVLDRTDGQLKTIRVFHDSQHERENSVSLLAHLPGMNYLRPHPAVTSLWQVKNIPGFSYVVMDYRPSEPIETASMIRDYETRMAMGQELPIVWSALTVPLQMLAILIYLEEHQIATKEVLSDLRFGIGPDQRLYLLDVNAPYDRIATPARPGKGSSEFHELAEKLINYLYSLSSPHLGTHWSPLEEELVHEWRSRLAELHGYDEGSRMLQELERVVKELAHALRGMLDSIFDHRQVMAKQVFRDLARTAAKGLQIGVGVREDMSLAELCSAIFRAERRQHAYGTLSTLMLKGGDVGGLQPEIKAKILARLSPDFEIFEGSVVRITLDRVLERWERPLNVFLDQLENSLPSNFLRAGRELIQQKDSQRFAAWLLEAQRRLQDELGSRLDRFLEESAGELSVPLREQAQSFSKHLDDEGFRKWLDEVEISGSPQTERLRGLILAHESMQKFHDLEVMVNYVQAESQQLLLRRKVSREEVLSRWGISVRDATTLLGGRNPLNVPEQDFLKLVVGKTIDPHPSTLRGSVMAPAFAPEGFLRHTLKLLRRGDLSDEKIILTANGIHAPTDEELDLEFQTMTDADLALFIWKSMEWIALSLPALPPPGSGELRKSPHGGVHVLAFERGLAAAS